MNKTPENFERISETASVSMNDEWFEYATEEHFWMQWRLRVLMKKLSKFNFSGKPMLEIGCGNGIFKTQMEKEGYTLDGCDLNETALNYAKKGKGRLFLYDIFDKNPELIHKNECVFLMDVIEHINDDTLFVKTATKYIRDGGYIIINVPAYNCLYSKYDKEVGHIRRYNKKQIREILKSCNITLCHIEYWGFFLIPIAFIRKIYLIFFPKNVIKSGIKPPNKFFNGIFKLLMQVELLFPFFKFAGASLIAIGKINNTPANIEKDRS